MLDTLPTRRSATVQAEQALRAAIVGGELAPGDRLPPERTLAARLGVSRLTLRAALATLSAAGLITVRHGSGYTVCDLRETGGTDLLPGLIEQSVSGTGRAAAASAIADVLRLRRHLAAAVLEAIAERPPTAAAKRAIHRAIDEFATAASNLESAGREPRAQAVALGAIADADLGVVRALLDATNSTILRVCLNPIVAVLRDHGTLREAIYREPAGNLAGWRALGVWIEQPTASAIPALLDVLAARDRATVDHLRGSGGRPRAPGSRRRGSR